MSGQIEEIKARIDIVDLISEYIKLKPAGPNNWRALCPFHNEKSPSFMVSKDKQIWHCFGCSEGGDILSFVQKMEGVEFAEALRTLAQKAGVKLVSQDPKLENQKNRLLDILQLTAKYWHQVLLDSPQATKARSYLKSRGVSEEIVSEFKIGYAADSWDALTKFLKSKRFSDQEIFLAGLVVKKERGEGFYDRFRDRLMFPINDLHGNTVGFSGRTLKEDEKGGKYINTPQTLVYNKSLALFNLDKAKNEIKSKDQAIIVEGQMDVISSYQSGTKNVIASSGTALTIDQIKILKRYTKNLAMAFDADSAGQSAAKRGIDLALMEEMNVKVIVLSGDKDPDACIRNNPQDWFDAVSNAKSIMDYYFDQTFTKFDSQKVEDKKEAAKVLLPVIAKIGNKIEQTHWLQKLADRLNVPDSILREALPGSEPKSVVKKGGALASPSLTSREIMLLERAIGIALKYPNNLDYLINNLTSDIIGNEALRSLYKKLIIYYTENINSDVESFDYSNFHSVLEDDALVQLADKLVLLIEKDFFDFDDSLILQELVTSINYTKKAYYSEALKVISSKIKQAEATKQSEEVKNLMIEFNKLLSKLNLLN